MDREYGRFALNKTLIGKLLILIAFCLLSACAQPPAPRETQPNNEDLQHTVTYSGETLGLIARWYTGKMSNWQLIVDANPGLRPERINLGQRINIPGSIVIERQPLPEDVVRRGASGTADRDVGAAPVKRQAKEMKDEPTLEDLVGLVEDKADSKSEPAVDAKADEVKPGAQNVEKPALSPEEAALAELLSDVSDDAPAAKKSEPIVSPKAEPAAAAEPAAKPADAAREDLLDELLAE